MHIDQATIDAVLADWTTAEVSPRLRAGLKLVEALTTHPQDIDAGFMTELEQAGLGAEELEAAANVAFHFNFINRLADAFDFPLLNDKQRRRLAKMLDRASRAAVARRPEPSHSRGADQVLRPVEVELGRAHALTTPGVTEPALREAVEAYAASWFGGQRTLEAELPTPLRSYVETVARWAYRVTDEDVEALIEAGYSEQAIFELTFAAAIGASVPALERLFSLMYS